MNDNVRSRLNSLSIIELKAIIDYIDNRLALDEDSGLSSNKYYMFIKYQQDINEILDNKIKKLFDDI